MYGIVEFSILPVGTGSPSVSKYVKMAHEVLKSRKFIIAPNSMGTVVEGEIEEILETIVEINKKLSSSSIKRVVTTIKIDYRIDKKVSIESKLKAIKS